MRSYDWEVGYFPSLQRGELGLGKAKQLVCLRKPSEVSEETTDSNPGPFHTKTCVFFSYYASVISGLTVGNSLSNVPPSEAFKWPDPFNTVFLLILEIFS